MQSVRGPQAFTCAFLCWVRRILRNARMALGGGEDPQQIWRVCSFTGHHACCLHDLGHILYLLSSGQLPQVLRVFKITSVHPFIFPCLHPCIFCDLVQWEAQALEPDDGTDFMSPSLWNLHRLFKVQEPKFLPCLYSGNGTKWSRTVWSLPLPTVFSACHLPLENLVKELLNQRSEKC